MPCWPPEHQGWTLLPSRLLPSPAAPQGARPCICPACWDWPWPESAGLGTAHLPVALHHTASVLWPRLFSWKMQINLLICYV